MSWKECNAEHCHYFNTLFKTKKHYLWTIICEVVQHLYLHIPIEVLHNSCTSCVRLLVSSVGLERKMLLSALSTEYQSLPWVQST